MKKVRRVIKFNQKASLNSYIVMNTELRKKPKTVSKEILMNNADFGKAMKNLRKHRDIKLVATGKWIKYLVSELNYHTTKFFAENMLAIKNEKNPVYSGLQIRNQ